MDYAIKWAKIMQEQCKRTQERVNQLQKEIHYAKRLSQSFPATGDGEASFLSEFDDARSTRVNLNVTSTTPRIPSGGNGSNKRQNNNGSNCQNNCSNNNSGSESNNPPPPGNTRGSGGQRNNNNKKREPAFVDVEAMPRKLYWTPKQQKRIADDFVRAEYDPKEGSLFGFISYWQTRLLQSGPHAPKDIVKALTNKVPQHTRDYFITWKDTEYPDKVYELAAWIIEYVERTNPVPYQGLGIKKFEKPSYTKTDKYKKKLRAIIKMESLQKYLEELPEVSDDEISTSSDSSFD